MTYPLYIFTKGTIITGRGKHPILVINLSCDNRLLKKQAREKETIGCRGRRAFLGP
jgi:hypothetical protein